MVNVLVLILSFLGLLAGVIVSHFTKEELKPGKKYFRLLEKVLLLAISFIIIFYAGDYFLFLIFGLLAGLIFRKVYFYFGLALPLASETFLVLLSSLVFVFGLPHGTLLTSSSKPIKIKPFVDLIWAIFKEVKKEIIISANLFLVAILISVFLGYYPLLMFVSGALIVISLDIKFWKFPVI